MVPVMALPQMRAVVSTFLRQRGVGAQDLGLPELVALGHLICGLSAAELRGLDSRELRWVYAHGECGPSPGWGQAPVGDQEERSGHHPLPRYRQQCWAQHMAA